MSFKRSGILILICMIMLCLSACGKKPNFVDAPESTQTDQYPRTYPDIATDPKP